jgi:hypothetical protein
MFVHYPYECKWVRPCGIPGLTTRTLARRERLKIPVAKNLQRDCSNLAALEPFKYHLPPFRECVLFGLQAGQPRTLETRQNLTSISRQKREVDGLPSHLRSISSRPINVGRDQAATPLRFGMDDQSSSLPEDVQHRDRIGWRRIHIEAERPEGICAVHEDISQTHLFGESGRTESCHLRIA